MVWFRNIFTSTGSKPKLGSEPENNALVAAERAMIVHDYMVAYDDSILFTPKLNPKNINSNLSSKLDRIFEKSTWLQNNHNKLNGIQTLDEEYSLNAALDESAIKDFEENFDSIPKDYRDFLILYGWNKFPFYGAHDFDIKPLNLEFSHPITEDHPLFDPSFSTIPKWFQQEGLNTLLISDFGCGIYYCLFLNGPEAGNVWRLDEANTGLASPIFPLNNGLERVKAVDWLEYWLDLEIKAFKKIGIKP